MALCDNSERISAVNYYHKELHLGCCSSLRSVSVYHDIIGISEEIDVNKTSASKECIFCKYWYFLDKGFKFQSSVCNCCYGVLMMSMNLNDIAILNTHDGDYCCIINEISVNEAINL